MINYYEILGIKRDIDGEVLTNKLHDNVDNLKRNAKQLNGKDKAYALVAASLCKRFLLVIDSYGSKEAYDKALDMSYGRIIKVKKYFNDSHKRKWVIGGSLAMAMITITSVAVGNNVKKVKVPVYPGDSISKICQDCGVEWYNMPLAVAQYSVETLKPDDVINVYVTNEKAGQVMEYVKTRSKEEELKNTKETYTFNYIVKPGDSISLLKERFSAIDIARPNAVFDVLNEGELVVIYTTDFDIASKMEEEYNNYLESLKPVDYDYYVVQPLDNLPDIARHYGVTCDQIMQYNPQIKSIGEINVGYELKIPVYSETKSNVK